MNNPYAPAFGYRQNVFAPYAATSGPLVGPGLRNAKLALGVVQMVALFAGIGSFVAGVVQDGNTTLMAVGGGLFAIFELMLIVYVVATLVWLHKFWSWLPPDQRWTPMWKKYISPNTATFFMLIPYFNIYWAFVVYLGIADILDRMQYQFPTSKASPKTLAILTCAIPIVFFPAGPFLQYVFAKHVEAMAAEMHPRMMSTPQSHY